MNTILPFPFLFGFLLSLVIAGAPGDGDVLCTVSRDVQARSAPAYNAEILMDSYNYLTLLSADRLQTQWQQVDLDANNAAGRGTEVRINTEGYTVLSSLSTLRIELDSLKKTPSKG